MFDSVVSPGMEPLTPLKEAARLLGISKTTAYTWVDAGTFPIPTKRVGKKIMVPTAALRRFLESPIPTTEEVDVA